MCAVVTGVQSGALPFLTLMVSSKGIAAVPRASLGVITATLAMFDLPVEGVALVFAIDHFLDMGRTATTVVGNAVATSVITKWEGMLDVPEAADADRPPAPAPPPPPDRKPALSGTSVTVCVTLGGRRLLQKKQNHT